MTFWLPLILAIIAAAVSIVAAVFSRGSATEARESAEMLNSRAHRIARLDAESDELREAFKEYASQLGKFSSAKDALSIMAALEVLAACQATTPELEAAAIRHSEAMAVSSVKGVADGVDPTPVRIAYRDAQKIVADKREVEALNRT